MKVIRILVWLLISQKIRDRRGRTSQSISYEVKIRSILQKIANCPISENN